jgi:hypothetical protein
MLTYSVSQKEIRINSSDFEKAEKVLQENQELNYNKEYEVASDYFTKSELKGDYDKYENISLYYKKIFTEFDNNDGEFKNTWNWAAFFFEWAWYFYHGMILYGIIILVISIILSIFLKEFSFIIFLINVFCGLHGNYDKYSNYKKKL